MDLIEDIKGHGVDQETIDKLILLERAANQRHWVKILTACNETLDPHERHDHIVNALSLMTMQSNRYEMSV